MLPLSTEDQKEWNNAIPESNCLVECISTAAAHNTYIQYSNYLKKNNP